MLLVVQHVHLCDSWAKSATPGAKGNQRFSHPGVEVDSESEAHGNKVETVDLKTTGAKRLR